MGRGGRGLYREVMGLVMGLHQRPLFIHISYAKLTRVIRSLPLSDSAGSERARP